MGEHTIRGTFGLDTKPVKDSLDDIERYAKKKAGDITKAVSGGGHGGPGGPGGGIVGGALSAAAGGGGVGELGSGGITRAVAAGTAIGHAAVKVFSEVLDSIVEVNNEAMQLQSNITKIVHSGMTTGRFETIDKLKEVITGAEKQADSLREKIGGFGGEGMAGKALGSWKATVEAAQRGKTPGGLREEIKGQIEELNKTAAGQIEKIATKSREIATIEEARFHTSQREAQVKAENFKNEEALGELSALTNLTGKQNLALTDEENRRHEEALKQIGVTNTALDREADTRQKNAKIMERTATTQRGISEIETRGFSRQQAALELSKGQLEVARQRQEAAENEVSAAKEAVETAHGLEGIREAQERLTQAQAGAQGAAGGVAKAAAGVADAESANRQAQSEEYNMGPAGRAAQYSQRLQEYRRRQRYADVTGTAQPTPPVMGEVDYDVDRSAKANRAAEIEQQAAQQEQARKQAEAAAKYHKERQEKGRGVAGKYGYSSDQNNIDYEGLANIEDAAQANAGMGVEGSPEAASGRARSSKGGEWQDLGKPDGGRYPWQIPDSEYADGGGETRKGGLMYPSSGEYPGNVPDFSGKDWMNNMAMGLGGQDNSFIPPKTPEPESAPDMRDLSQSTQPGLDAAIASIAEKVATAVAGVMREFWQ